MTTVEVEKAYPAEIAGTCLQGYIDDGYTYQDLVDVFGEPDLTGSGDDKVAAQWLLHVDDYVATIYNYKTGINYDPEDGQEVEDITDWHIGGVHSAVVDLVNQVLRESKGGSMKITATQSTVTTKEKNRIKAPVIPCQLKTTATIDESWDFSQAIDTYFTVSELQELREILASGNLPEEFIEGYIGDWFYDKIIGSAIENVEFTLDIADLDKFIESR